MHRCGRLSQTAQCSRANGECHNDCARNSSYSNATCDTKYTITPMERRGKTAQMRHLEDCPACDGSGRVSIAHYMKYGGPTKCELCNGTGQIYVLDKEPETD